MREGEFLKGKEGKTRVSTDALFVFRPENLLLPHHVATFFAGLVLQPGSIKNLNAPFAGLNVVGMTLSVFIMLITNPVLLCN